MRFRCLGLCEAEEETLLRLGAEEFARQAGCEMTWEGFTRREELLYRMRDGCCDAVVVALRGALGMESVLGVRDINGAVPLIWISDDAVFAMQSYRMRVDMFLQHPVTADQVARAFRVCVEKRT